MIMKNVKFSILLLALASFIMFSCDDEEEPDPSLVNFAQEAYNITTDDLTPFDVTLTIEPAATKASEIVVSLSGATPGTEFTTTPAASGGSVTIPVSEGDTEVSFTVTPDEEGIGFDNVNIDMLIISVGEGLTTGITIEGTISITNTLDTGTDIPYSETFETCAPDVELPGGFEAKIIQQNTKGTAGWKCVTFAGLGAAASNPFSDCAHNESDPSETWLVSPRLNLTQATSAMLTFDAALVFGPFDNPDWDVRISTDYNGENFDASTWTRLEDAYDLLSQIPRGNDLNTITQDLSGYSGNVVTIAIAHIMPGTGCDNSGAFRIQNFSVSE
jgi:hypothetical protein